VDALAIRFFSDKLCKNLRVRSRRAAENVARFNFRRGEANEILVRIEGDDGEIAREVTAKQLANGRTVGTAVQLSCYICRKYLDGEGDTVHKNTRQFALSDQ
jgi:hypothetical protein